MGSSEGYYIRLASTTVHLKELSTTMGWTDWVDNVYGPALGTWELVSNWKEATGKATPVIASHTVS